MTAHTTLVVKKIQLNFAPVLPTSTPSSGVDVWLLDLSVFANKSHAEFSAFVSTDELIRASQFKKNSTRFLATRAFLRLVLARYTELNPKELLFARAEHGKPFLSNAPGSIHFNLSHCDDIAVLAVSAQGEIGIDVENINARDYLKIAKRYFHSNELQALYDCPVAERDSLFYKFWTLKEAFFKATGGGISSGLDKIFFQFDKDSIKANVNPLLNIQENEWQFHQEFIAPNTLVALALHAAQPIKRQWFNGNSLLSGI